MSAAYTVPSAEVSSTFIDTRARSLQERGRAGLKVGGSRAEHKLVVALACLDEQGTALAQKQEELEDCAADGESALAG